MVEVKAILNKTYSEAESMYNYNKLSPRAWRQYRKLWIWSAIRYGGIAGKLQDRYFFQHGYDRLMARIDRVCRVIIQRS